LYSLVAVQLIVGYIRIACLPHPAYHNIDVGKDWSGIRGWIRRRGRGRRRGRRWVRIRKCISGITICRLYVCGKPYEQRDNKKHQFNSYGLYETHDYYSFPMLAVQFEILYITTPPA
jgi:hypothetical protein